MNKRFIPLLIGFLLGLASSVNAQAPQQPGPFGVKPSAKAVELGRALFFDKRLSVDGTVSCASCHDPRKGWGDGRSLAVGIGSQVGPRHTPTIINATYSPHMFWDGRTVGSETQALLPLSNPIEMGDQRLSDVLLKLRLIPGYVKRFADTFDIDPREQSAITAETMAFALSAFETGIVSVNLPVDRYLAGDKSALSADAQVGLRIFDAANCKTCHKPPHWTDHGFHNNGFEFSGVIRSDRRADLGRFTEVPPRLRTNSMRSAFKTPTLAHVAETAPYGHHGMMESLERVVRHYNGGGADYRGLIDRNQDPRIKPLGLTETQEKYLVRFLREGFSGKYPMIEAPSQLP